MQSSPRPSKPNALGALLLCRTPGLGSLAQGSELWPVWKSLQYNDSRLWAHLGGWDLLMYCQCTLLPFHGFFFMALNLTPFWVDSSLFIDGCSAVTCDFGMLVKEVN